MKNKIRGIIFCIGIYVLSVLCLVIVNQTNAYAINAENAFTVNQISEDLFGTSEINYSCNLYNYDESEDFIYVEYKNGGYAVFFKPTMELMEYSKNGRLPYANTSDKQYYGGPNSYFRKVNGDLQNIVTGERLDYSEIYV